MYLMSFTVIFMFFIFGFALGITFFYFAEEGWDRVEEYFRKKKDRED